MTRIALETGAGRKIMQNDLELTVEHFHEEADREGKPFSAKGTDAYKRVEKIARAGEPKPELD